MKLRGGIYNDSSLGAEAVQIVNEAAAPIQKWINEGLDDIEADFKKKVNEVAGTLQEEHDSMREAFQKLEDTLQSNIDALESLNKKIHSLDSASLGQEIQENLEAMKVEREALRKRYRELGSTPLKKIIDKLFP